jgi:hypothetical protein
MSLTLSPCKPAAAAARKRKGAVDGEATAGGTIEQIEKVAGAGWHCTAAGNAQPSALLLLPLTPPAAVTSINCFATSLILCCHPPHSPQIVHVRQPGSLEMRQRSVRQLSGAPSAAAAWRPAVPAHLPPFTARPSSAASRLCLSALLLLFLFRRAARLLRLPARHFPEAKQGHAKLLPCCPLAAGGERRRVALALALGFSELAAQRGRLRRWVLPCLLALRCL